MNDPDPHSAIAAGEEAWMKLALRLATKGRGSASPNPMVGAVVVDRSGRLAGAGWHRGPGKPHAEVLALAEAGEKAMGSVLFVNLEPCSHHGRTPPCTEAILRSGIGKVVCASEDPDERVAGKGIHILRRDGVRVEVGLLQREADELNREYLMHRSRGRPYVTLKMAASLDGRTSAADGSSRWITGEAARRDVHRERNLSDAVLVGVGTVLADDPSLTARAKGSRRPCRVVIDSLARTPPEARVLQDGVRTLVFTSKRAPAARVKALRSAGAEVVTTSSRDRTVPLSQVLGDLAERSVLALLLEGGPTLAGSFASEGLIDRYLIYVAPKLLGAPSTKPVLSGWQASSIGDARSLRISSVRRLGGDLRVEAFPLAAPETGPGEYLSEESRRLGRQ